MTTSIVVPIIVAAIAGMAAGLSPYLIERRKGSGSVATSDAGKVFEAATAYMTRLADDNGHLRARIDTLEDRESECLERVRQLQEQLMRTRAELGLGEP